MQSITRTLLQNSILDLLFAAVILIAEPQIVVISGIYYNVIGSPLYVLGFEFAGIAIPAYGGFIVVSIVAMPIPFYIRYTILCKNAGVTMKKLIGIYIVLIIYSIALFFAAMWCYPPNPDAYIPFKAALNNSFWLDEYKNGAIFVATPSSDIRIIIVFLMILIPSGLSYLLIIIFGLKIKKQLKMNQFNMSEKTMILNKQLQQTLVIQSIAPFFTANVPVFILVSMCLFTLENHYVSLGCCSLLSWASVINPVAAIMIIKPFRKRVEAILGRKQQPQSSTTHAYAISNKVTPHPATMMQGLDEAENSHI
uniref:Uncharacterized protein n=1 Tax=Panagrolaimus davidi TaxID=227884 RepID=A0A914P9G2_9BILA